MQAISGAGYPGVSSMDILDNVVPFIGGEEEKMEEQEPQKLLGTFDGKGMRYAELIVSAHCNRVATRNGHLEAVSVEIEVKADRGGDPGGVAVLQAAGPAVQLAQRAPAGHPVDYGPDRPQPRLDRMAGSVPGHGHCDGAFAPGPTVRLQVHGAGAQHHRGTAGGSLLNAELMVARGYFGQAVPSWHIRHS